MYQVTLVYESSVTTTARTPIEPKDGFVKIDNLLVPAQKVDCVFLEESDYQVTYPIIKTEVLFVESVSFNEKGELQVDSFCANAVAGYKLLGHTIVESDRQTLFEGEFTMHSEGYREISEEAYNRLNVMRCMYFVEAENFSGYADANKVVVLYADRLEPRYFKV